MSEKVSKEKNFFLYYPECEYPKVAPYDPEERYPEYPFELEENANLERNDVYRMVREVFFNCNMDIENYNSMEWNPLGEYIKPGNTVLIKPNLVMHDNKAEIDEQRKMDCLITHPSVVRCLFDYVYIALKGRGKIVIADAPIQDCKFDVLLQKSGYGRLFHEITSRNSDELVIVVADLRETFLEVENKRQRQKERIDGKYSGKIIDLKNNSMFEGIRGKNNLRITNYASKDTVSHHSNGKNEYCISEAVLQADVVISIPKPKTHRIAGYTAALKNMIGINTRKEFLPHHRKGAKGKSGDEYVGTHRLLKQINSFGNDIKNLALKYQKDFWTDFFNGVCRYTGKKLDKLEENRKKFGMWHGNDTIWRTILDVNRIVYFCDKSGNICSEPQRKVLHFGDMIVCGEKEGPLHPSYKKVGGILFSENPVLFDLCVVKLMGFDYEKIPTLLNASKECGLNKENINVIKLWSNEDKFNKKIKDINCNFHFTASAGWEEFLKK